MSLFRKLSLKLLNKWCWNFFLTNKCNTLVFFLFLWLVLMGRVLTARWINMRGTFFGNGLQWITWIEKVREPLPRGMYNMYVSLPTDCRSMRSGFWFDSGCNFYVLFNLNEKINLSARHIGIRVAIRRQVVN